MTSGKLPLALSRQFGTQASFYPSIRYGSLSVDISNSLLPFCAARFPQRNQLSAINQRNVGAEPRHSMMFARGVSRGMKMCA